MGHDYTEKSSWCELILKLTTKGCFPLFTEEVSQYRRNLGAGDPDIEIQLFDLGSPHTLQCSPNSLHKPNKHYVFQIAFAILWLGKPAITTSPSSLALVSEFAVM